MRTTPYLDVLHGIAKAAGLDPNTADLSPEQAASITEMVNVRLREAWEHAFWRELMTVEQRAYRDAYDAATTYEEGDEVWVEADDAYYTALGTVTGEDPGTSANWEEAEELARYVAYEQTGKTAIDAVAGVTRTDPRGSLNPKRVPWFLSERGIEVHVAPNQVWISFRTRAPVMASDIWSQEASYAAGDRVIYEREVWKALAANEAETPAEGATWTKVSFPYLLETVVKEAVRADLLREDGQDSKAIAADVRAKDLLLDLELKSFDAQSYGEPGY
jgi:hypothetical protein